MIDEKLHLKQRDSGSLCGLSLLPFCIFPIIFMPRHPHFSSSFLFTSLLFLFFPFFLSNLESQAHTEPTISLCLTSEMCLYSDTMCNFCFHFLSLVLEPASLQGHLEIKWTPHCCTKNCLNEGMTRQFDFLHSSGILNVQEGCSGLNINMSGEHIQNKSVCRSLLNRCSVGVALKSQSSLLISYYVNSVNYNHFAVGL